jgi:hypothetical protein
VRFHVRIRCSCWPEPGLQVLCRTDALTGRPPGAATQCHRNAPSSRQLSGPRVASREAAHRDNCGHRAATSANQRARQLLARPGCSTSATRAWDRAHRGGRCRFVTNEGQGSVPPGAHARASAGTGRAGEVRGRQAPGSCTLSACHDPTSPAPRPALSATPAIPARAGQCSPV